MALAVLWQTRETMLKTLMPGKSVVLITTWVICEQLVQLYSFEFYNISISFPTERYLCYISKL